MSELDTVSLQFDGIGRYHSEIKVLIHSHVGGEPLDISQDVIACNTHKGVKSEGKANLTITGTTNYLSWIYPDDYINIYFNIGDGKGWVRNFFGFVDRVQESYKVSDTGTPVTTYTIACTDFTKAINKTQLYTNPHIMNRRDTVGQAFGIANVGGVSWIGRGIRAAGSPADIVLNFLYIFMGFASQYLLPSSYNPAFLERYRRTRTEYLLRNTPVNVREMITGAGGFDEFTRNIELDTRARTFEAGGDPEGPLDQAAFRRQLSERLNGRLDYMGQVLSAYQASAEETPPSLLDVIDTTTFVEREAIDGYTFSETIWMQEGSLLSVLASNSNEMVNEMFFDLRPCTTEEGLINTPDYAKEPDEISGNLTEEGEAGVRYVPALIMREYPFSTIHSIDGSNIDAGTRQADGTVDRFGIMHFGPIFSHSPNRPGRHVIQMPNINLGDIGEGISTPAFKHLDVVVVDQTEIMESDLGRSDHDHFNLIEAISTDIIGEQSQFVMNRELPIITPVHIIRHGLRTRRLDSKFARFSPRVANARSAANAASRSTVTETSATEERDTRIRSQPEAADLRRPTTDNWRRLEALANAYAPYGCQGVNDLVLGATMHSEYGVNAAEAAASGRAAFNEHTIAVAWCAKNIAQTGYNAGGGQRGTGATGGRSNYRNGTGSTTNIAEAIMPSFVPGRNRGSTGDGSARPQVTARFPGFVTLTDSAGQTVYDVAAMTALMDSDGLADHLSTYFRRNPTAEAQVRAYFDVARGVLDGSIPDPAVSRSAGGSITFFHSSYATVTDDPLWGASPESREARMARYRRNFNYYRIDPVTPGSKYSHIFSRSEITTMVEEEDASTPASTSDGPSNSAANNVDNALTRQTLLRWALLHDHWYQHNLEYLSGSIMMRGSPNIRPGYRLDLVDRHLSFYVEAVGQQFQYPNKLTTTVDVSRGQPNNPYPMYVMPNNDGFDPAPQQRLVDSRLDQYYHVVETASTQRALSFRNNDYTPYEVPEDANVTDLPLQRSTITRVAERVIEASSDMNNNNSGLGDPYAEMADALRAWDEMSSATEAPDTGSFVDGANLDQPNGQSLSPMDQAMLDVNRRR